MGEPLCTYKLYSRFRDLSGKTNLFKLTIDVKINERLEKIKEICSNLPEINKNVFVFIIRFLR